MVRQKAFNKPWRNIGSMCVQCMPNAALSALLRVNLVAWHGFSASRTISDCRSPSLSIRLKQRDISAFSFWNFTMNSIQSRWFVYLIYFVSIIFTKSIYSTGVGANTDTGKFTRLSLRTQRNVCVNALMRAPWRWSKDFLINLGISWMCIGTAWQRRQLIGWCVNRSCTDGLAKGLWRRLRPFWTEINPTRGI